MDGTHEEQVLTIVRWLKDGPPGGLPVRIDDGPLASLEAITWRDANNSAALAQLTLWRQAEQGPSVLPGLVRAWLVEQVLDIPDRLLFWVKAPDDRPIGHVGLLRFDFAARTADLGLLLRGVEDEAPGIMSAAVRTLSAWAFDSLSLTSLCLRVPADNARAVRLGRRCGFREMARARLALVRDEEEREEREMVTMRLERGNSARAAA
jgi:RimJ/RimL family protein N-acetyltransferase